MLMAKLPEQGVGSFCLMVICQILEVLFQQDEDLAQVRGDDLPGEEGEAARE